MTTWLTADLHLGHSNIIRYCDRPFLDVDAMNRGLIDRWNEVVDDGDGVWMLGDFAMGKIDETLPLVGKLRGRKLLLTGNHDRCWADHGRRAEGWTERYLQAGFAEVIHGQIDLDVGGTDVVACHFPYRGDSHDQDRYVDQRPVDRTSPLVRGRSKTSSRLAQASATRAATRS